MKKIGVLLSGRGSNFKAIYDALKKGQIKNATITAVISNKKDAPGLVFAKNEDLDTFYVDPSEYRDRKSYDSKMADILRSKDVDLVCLAGYMKVLSPFFIKSFENRILNIHPSLLPSFPGLNAQKKALEYGVKIAGCTVHFVDEKVDHGPIILQKAVDVMDDDTEKSLSDRILKKEHEIYPEAIKLFLEERLAIKDRKVFVSSA